MADYASAPSAGTGNTGNTFLETTQNNAAAAYNSVTSGPVAQGVRDSTEKTTGELSNLAASRKTPNTPAATGQPLTHYHSFFSELLSWNNPRASAIAYASFVTFIFAARYLDVTRWAFKLAWMTLGVTVAAEVIGKTLLNNGLATQLRPRRYYTVPRETLDTMLGDVHELINFFVIESQRILFAENVPASAIACVSSFLAYYLIKLVPYWGLAIIGTTLAFFVPLVYTTNQELIDHHLRNASDVISSQTAQVRDVATKQADQISSVSKQYAGDYTSKVQEMLGSHSASSAPASQTSAPVSNTPDFPSAPTAVPRKSSNPVDSMRSTTGPVEPLVPMEPVVPEQEPMIAS